MAQPMAQPSSETDAEQSQQHGQSGHRTPDGVDDGAHDRAHDAASGHGPERWVAPAPLIGLAARAVAALMPAAGSSQSLSQCLAATREARACLVVDARNLMRVCTDLRGEITVILPRGARLDAIAALCRAAGSGVIRWSIEDPRPDIGEDARTVPVLALEPGGDIAGAAAHDGIGDADYVFAAAAALARAIIPLAIDSARSRRTWSLGLPFAQAVTSRPVNAPRGPTHFAPDDGRRRAHVADRLTAIFDEASTREAGLSVRGRRGAPVLPIYALVMNALSPIARPYLWTRLRAGKEDASRLSERFGRATIARPDGRLAWVHAASVGETLSVLPLVRAIVARELACHVLITTGTVTSARLLHARSEASFSHQFIPLDVPRYARRFLDHWQPDMAIFVESELWPNMMREIGRRAVTFATVNGRMSERSFSVWQRWPRTARALLAIPDLVLAQSREHALRYAQLGARDVRHVGNLKFDAPPPPAAASEIAALESTIGDRPVWLAASTHDGEEEIVAEAHLAIRERHPDTLTILVPRHPERGAEIARMLEERWLVASRRSMGEALSAKTDIYLADTLGELGMFYRLAKVAMVGGSFVPVGGHNPIEPAQLGCAVLHGPHVHNFADTYAALDALGGSLAVATSAELAAQVSDLLTDTDRRNALTATGRAEIERNAGSLDRALSVLAPQLAS